MRGLKILAATATLACFVSHAALAIEVTQTVSTSASPDKVWSLIGDFSGIAKWLPPAASSPADKGNGLGSVRVITLKAPGNPTVTETLVTYDGAGHSYSYTIDKVDPAVLPVTSYRSTISVKAGKAGSEVTWMGEFKAAAGTDDATAAKAITGVYRAGLDNIKAVAEK
jgi:hypothetical protein